jgi:hypothetical protein
MRKINGNQPVFPQYGQIILSHKPEPEYIFGQLNDNRMAEFLLISHKSRHQIFDAGIKDIDEGYLEDDFLKFVENGFGDEYAGQITYQGNDKKHDQYAQPGHVNGNDIVQKLNS